MMPVSPTQSASDDVLVDLIPKNIINTIASLPNQANLQIISLRNGDFRKDLSIHYWWAMGVRFSNYLA